MQRIKAAKLGLSIHQLPPSILDVIDGLSSAGYQAYIVGGGVRDLILGLNPKDFDAVTNATPAQIKQVFGRRCRIIGRRFELAHVYSGREIIEVATFRTTPKKAITSANGMILRDNHWGTIEDDFARRDFSINALYYQPQKGIVLDFCGAVKDIQQRRLRLLGHAKQRFEEDPVRMLRAIRFAAKLEFELDPAIVSIFNEDLTKLLRDVSPHRLYDESQKLFTSGVLSKILPMLIHYQLWQHLFQDVPAKITPLIHQSAKNTDLRLQQGKTINPAFFYAVLLWQVFTQRCDKQINAGKSPSEARVNASLDVLKRQAQCTAYPRFVEIFIRETWEMQERLMNPKPTQIMSLSQHTRFRAGFDFLVLREQAKTIDTQGMSEWWDRFQYMNNDDKQAAIKQYQRQLAKKRHQQKIEQAQERVNKPKKINQAIVEKASTESYLNDDLDMQPLATLFKQAKLQQVALDDINEQWGQLDDELQEESLEPLLTDEKTQRYQLNRAERMTRVYFDENSSEKHPILKRKRVKRDLSQVIFGPIQ